MKTRHLLLCCITVWGQCLCSCENKEDSCSTVDSSFPTPAENVESQADEDFEARIIAVIDGVSFASFSVTEMPINDVLTKIEDHINNAPITIGRKVRIVNLNSGDRKITISLRNVSVRTLFELIEKQSSYGFSVDGNAARIIFSADGDSLGEDESEAEDTPELPRLK